MTRRRLALEMLLGLCVILGVTAGCCHPSFVPGTSDRERPYDAALRVRVVCATGSESAKLGSAVAITSRYALTARHVVACGGAPVALVLVATRQGEYMTATVVETAESDAALLRVNGQFLLRSAPIRSSPTSVGEELCVIAGDDMEVHSIRACGWVAASQPGVIVVSFTVVPGNSGGPVYDVNGALVGIVRGGRWDAGVAHWAAVTPIDAMGDLLHVLTEEAN